MNIYEIEKICNSKKWIRLFSYEKQEKKQDKVEKDNERGNNMYRQKRMGKIQREEGDEAVKLKDVGNVMLDFLKVPCSIPVNNVSWNRLNVETKFLGELFFIWGKWFPLRKNFEIRQTKNRNPYCLHRIV
jgi:hypothetical protein